MRDKRAAKCFKYNNNNLVLVIICFSRFVSLASVGSVVSFRSFRFGGFVSLFRVLVHALLIIYRSLTSIWDYFTFLWFNRIY